MRTQIYDQSDLFHLTDGRVIVDPSISSKMHKLQDIDPANTQIDSTGYSWDENGMGDLFSEIYEDTTCYCPERKTWYTYSGGRWVRDTEGLLVSGRIREFVRLLALYGATINDQDKRDKWMAFVGKMGDRRFRDRLMKDIKDNVGVPAERFDNKPYLINCSNGTYDLETMTFREHNREDYLTMQSPVEFSIRRLDTIRCTRWEEFIQEVTSGDTEKADYLQRALGYSLLGTSNEECMFILYGKTTRNGKSTLLGAVDYILGDYAATAPVAIICKAGTGMMNSEAPSPVLAGLKGIRFVSMSESNQYGKMDEETVKQLTGGEEITARNLHEKPIRFLPQFSLWLSCNDLPAVRDKSLFASDRVRVITFDRHFSASERDTGLKDYFRTKEAMQGIFSWLLQGYIKYRERGLEMPASVRKVVMQYECDNDLVLMFLDETCVMNMDGKVKCKSLYDRYKIWCHSNGYYSQSSRKFYEDVMGHVDWCNSKIMVNGYPFFRGMDIKEGGSV